MSNSIAIVGSFDDLRSRDVRLLEEASKLGPVTVLAACDEDIQAQTGKGPKFPIAERLYLLRALRFVAEARVLSGSKAEERMPKLENIKRWVWVDAENPSNQARRKWCGQNALEYRVLPPFQLTGFPESPLVSAPTRGKRVVVTGCYDWFHSGHVRFFEEVSAYGDLYVIVGHDANIRLLKGEGHPLLPQQERRYMTGSVRYVTQALISSGEGWLDADPEIQKLQPDIYAVNEDGDRGGKHEYCAQRGIEYLVLKRAPAPGLPHRSSTELRGF